MSVNFTGVTFANQKVTPAYDAIIRRALLDDGVLTGCELSYSGSTLTMTAGQLMICGRQIVHPSSQNWAVTEATTGYARLVLTIDLTRTSTKDNFDQVVDAVEYASAVNGFSDLEQADINAAGSKYQVAVCVVSLGPGGITGIVSQLDATEGGGAGGILTVTAPAGVAVTVSKDNKSKSKISGVSGVAVFKGLASGTWTVSISDGSQTASKPVVITADYSTIMAFFSATINVTYPSGSTCTATDGTTTLTAPDTGGTWACVVPNAGTWAITTTNGEKTKSGTVTISTDGETTSITLAYTLELFKDGAEVVDWTYLPRNYSVAGVDSMTLADMTGKAGEGYQNKPTFYTTTKVDVTDYETLVLKLSDATGAGTVQFGVISSVPPSGVDDTIPFDAKVSPSSFTGATSLSVDVSGITGEYYIALTLVSTWGNSFTAKTSDIYLV